MLGSDKRCLKAHCLPVTLVQHPYSPRRINRLTDGAHILVWKDELADQFFYLICLHTVGIQNSHTSSRFTLSGLNFDKTLTANYKQTITVNYADAAGKKNSVDVTFDVTAPHDPNDPNAVKAAREATVKSLRDALEKDSTLKDRFTVVATNSGVSLVSQQQGKDALNITSMELAAGAKVSFGGQKATPAVLSNEGAVKNGMGYGALESTRQMLVGSGEFSTDAAYNNIRGIPYYMRSLDMLANKIATEMNRINTTNANGESLAGLGIKGAGNLFVADGDDPDHPTQLITASNISISKKWQTGETTVVPSTKPDAVSSENDNINRFYNILNEAYNYQATDIVRQDKTPFTSGKLEQTGTQVQNLKAQITYIDSMNQKHTVTVAFQSGADADATLTNLQAAIARKPELSQFDDIEVKDGTITLKANDGKIDDGVLCSLVTDIQITDNQGAATGAFKMGAGKIGGAVASSNIYQGNLESCYSNMEGVLGSHINTTSKIYETYATAADEINTSRDSVSGVDLNDEGIDLLQYQKSFAAACRLMTALDEAMDKVINGMGVVGR